MKSDNAKIILACIITFCMSCFFNAAASGTLFDSNEVSYDNSNSGINASDVQNAVDKLYAAATDYSSIDSRVSSLEQTKAKIIRNNASGYLDGTWVSSGTDSTGSDGGFRAADSSDRPRGYFYFANGSSKTYLTANSATGWGDGVLDLRGSQVLINGVNMNNVTQGTAEIDTAHTKVKTDSASVKYFQLGRLVIVYMNDVCPKDSNPTSNSILAKGLPVPVASTGTTISPYYTEKYSDYRVEIKTDGKLYWWYTYGGSECQIAAGQLIYFAS